MKSAGLGGNEQYRHMARIAIIGAGPAGSAAAFHLARAGHHVTLIERHPFPRTKVCGEFISPAATSLLEEIVPKENLLRAGARRVGEITLGWSDSSCTWPMPRQAWALSRETLDEMLLARACSAGSHVLQPAIVRSVAYANDGVRLRLASGETIAADLVIHADGSGRHDPAGAVWCDRDLLALKCHCRGQGPSGVRMDAAVGAYVGTVQVEGGLCTCALVVRKHLLANHENDIDSLVASLGGGFHARKRLGDWLACGVLRSPYVVPGHSRSFRIGNAAGAVDPVGGEGIGLALWAGASLAGLLAPRRTHAASTLAEIQRRFGDAYRRRLRVRSPVCRHTANALMRPAIVSALSPLLRFPALAMSPWYRLSGKAQNPEIPGIAT